jgi:hypothetical protein
VCRLGFPPTHPTRRFCIDVACLRVRCLCVGLGATRTPEQGLAGVRAAGGGCPLWVPPAGSPVRLIYLAPVLLHPQLIEARRSGAERISGGLT